MSATDILQVFEVAAIIGLVVSVINLNVMLSRERASAAKMKLTHDETVRIVVKVMELVKLLGEEAIADRKRINDFMKVNARAHQNAHELMGVLAMHAGLMPSQNGGGGGAADRVDPVVAGGGGVSAAEVRWKAGNA